ncbi:MAG: hypothetical protein P1P82_14390 [Bacteroidales bacterium]|nr:hypothetical protein [Bacteroidales bacterium]
MRLKDLFLIGLVLIILSSCEKEILESTEQIQKPLPQFDAINFSIDDNVLNFETLDDYSNMLEYLYNLGYHRFPDFEEQIGFNSLRTHLNQTKDNSQIESEYMLTLLNPEYSIIVGGYKLTYSIESEEIAVKNLYLKSADQLFSWDDDVDDILFHNGVKKNVASACPSNRISEAWSATNTDIEAFIDYNNIPLFYELKAKITKTRWRPGVDILVEVGRNELGSSYPTYYAWLSDGYTKEFNGGVDEEPDGGISATVSIDDNKLTAYSCYARFTSWDEYQTPSVVVTEWVYMGCHTSELDY